MCFRATNRGSVAGLVIGLIVGLRKYRFGTGLKDTPSLPATRCGVKVAADVRARIILRHQLDTVT